MRRSTLLRSGILCSTLLSLLILLPGWTTTGDAVPPSSEYNALVPPVAGFTGFPTVGVAPLAVSFSDMSSGGVTSWAWSFGDGGTSTLVNPSHTFTTPGNYTVIQTVTSSGGTATMTRTDYIVVLAQPVGPDVIVGSITGRVNYGSVGGTSAYSVGTTSCNIGTQNLAWISGTNQHPVIGQNLYRLKGGVMDHIGVNWLKHGFFALDQSLCDTCSPTGGTSLGVGCSDPYGASLNGSQSPLGPRSEVDAATGAFLYPVSLSPSFNTTIGRRLQAHDVDIDPALNPGARYFVEAQYVTPDDASFGNKHNNASYREVSFSPSGSTFNLAYVGSTQRQRQAIIAWQDVDPEVSITHLDIPGDGRLTVGVKIWDLGNGNWRHVYAVHNLNSDRSVSAISVALPAGTTITASTFNDVDYHSGEVWSGTDWPPSIASNGISWAATQTYNQNQDSNAIRWGSSYTFTFDADAVGGAVTLDLFKPGTPTSTTFTPPNAPAPVAGFSGTPTSGVVPLMVSFSDTSSGNITSWSWDFGDGATSTVQNPTHTYSTPGSYQVTLTVVGPEGSDTLVVPSYINPQDPAPVAAFFGSPTIGVAPLSMSFTDQSTGNITSWSWSFGDGATSSLQNPSHTYGTAGFYSVALTVSGPGGPDTLTQNAYIQVLDPPPTAVFSGTPTTGAAPLAVSFSDQSSGNVTSWSWSFGDGSTSTLQNPSHTYSTVGTYTVALTATGPGGTDTITTPAYVNVLDPPPVAALTGSPTNGVAPLTVNFSDQSTGNVTAWSWTFGDGTTSTSANPTHAYATPGTYDVSLTVTGAGGSDTASNAAYVTVLDPPPVAGFAGAPTSGVAPLTVGFTDQTSGNVSSWSWTFGDGTTSTLQNPSHTYSAPGSYAVALTATGPGGFDTVTSPAYVTVLDPPPAAAFSGAPTSGIAPVVVNFTDQSTGNVTGWAWSFGDTGTSTFQNPSHVYMTPGIYDVSLTVTGPGGSDTVTSIGHVTVLDPPPVAAFSASPTSGVAPVQVTFTDQSVGTVTSWSWSFGDGATSLLQNPTHAYLAPGSYSVTLTVTGPGGVDTLVQSNHITATEKPVYLSFDGPTALPGVGPVEDEDVVLWDPVSQSWSMHFDGSDMGLAGTDINAFHVFPDGSVLMSFSSPTFVVPGLLGGPSGNQVDSNDLVLFGATTTGATTSGFMLFIFDGSDVGLNDQDGGIDGVSVIFDTWLLISTEGQTFTPSFATLPGEDLTLFLPTLYGPTTTGFWFYALDGSDVGLSGPGEDIDALHFDEIARSLLSTDGAYSAGVATGLDADVSRFVGTYGATAGGTIDLLFDFSAMGVTSGVNGLSVKQN